MGAINQLVISAPYKSEKISHNKYSKEIGLSLSFREMMIIVTQQLDPLEPSPITSLELSLCAIEPIWRTTELVP